MDSTVSETSLDLDALTEDEFLGGQLRLLQPRHGYRGRDGRGPARGIGAG